MDNTETIVVRAFNDYLKEATDLAVRKHILHQAYLKSSNDPKSKITAIKLSYDLSKLEDEYASCVSRFRKLFLDSVGMRNDIMMER